MFNCTNRMTSSLHSALVLFLETFKLTAYFPVHPQGLGGNEIGTAPPRVSRYGGAPFIAPPQGLGSWGGTKSENQFPPSRMGGNYLSQRGNVLGGHQIGEVFGF